MDHDLKMLIEAADRRYAHLRKCNGTVSKRPCRICAEAQEFFAEQPPQVLSHLLAEPVMEKGSPFSVRPTRR